MNLKQYALAEYAAAFGEAVCIHAHQTSIAMSVILPLFEIYQISL